MKELVGRITKGDLIIITVIIVVVVMCIPAIKERANAEKAKIETCEIACKASGKDKWEVLSGDKCECWNEDCSIYNFKGTNYTLCIEIDKAIVRVRK